MPSCVLQLQLCCNMPCEFVMNLCCSKSAAVHFRSNFCLFVYNFSLNI